ncbi:MAG: formylglycine-generating enzyme family protein, partial [Polyangiaceae bacterium]|nr:formylglycine-generating enzyme family protein [Polyangiaceae bacterium]
PPGAGGAGGGGGGGGRRGPPGGVGGPGGGSGAGGRGGQSFDHCKDQEHNGDETDVDCGGSCKPCDHGLACKQEKDCFSGVCEGLICTAACPADMVLIQSSEGAFCIDANEVTQAQYAQFLAKAPSLSEQSAVCSFNQTFQPENNVGGTAACGPSSYDPVNKADRPVVCVDWCDAQAYCRAVGKRLCGSIQTGGPLLWDFASRWAQDEWYRACSGEQLKHWPYGDIYDKNRCNGKELGKGTTVSVSEMDQCEGGYPGIFNMSGNAIEWMDACKPDDDPTKPDLCLIRGGSFFDDAASLTCSKTFSMYRNQVASDVGFRCCGG